MFLLWTNPLHSLIHTQTDEYCDPRDTLPEPMLLDSSLLPPNLRWSCLLSGTTASILNHWSVDEIMNVVLSFFYYKNNFIGSMEFNQIQHNSAQINVQFKRWAILLSKYDFCQNKKIIIIFLVEKLVYFHQHCYQIENSTEFDWKKHSKHRKFVVKIWIDFRF